MPRLTRLVAPAGYGKTILLQQWIQRWQDQVIILAIGLDAEVHITSPGHDLFTLVTEYLWSPIEVDGAELRAAFRHIGQPCALILDQADTIPCHRLEALVQDLLLGRNAPQHLKIIISGRTDIRHPIGQLTTTGDTVRLCAADLAFSVAELEQLVTGNASSIANLPTIDSLLQLTHGWPAGVKLALDANLSNDDNSNWVALDDYLQSLLASKLSTPTRDLLTTTATFPFLTENLWQAIAADMEGEIAPFHEVVGLVPFARWHDAELGHGVTHLPLLAASLQRLGRTIGTSHHLSQVTASAGSWLIEHHREDAAVALAASTHVWASVLTQLSPHCRELGLRDDHERLVALLSPAPHHELLKHRDLTYWYLLSMMSGSQFASVVSLYQKVAREWSEIADQQIQGRLILLKALGQISTGDRHGALASAQEALDILPKGCHVERMRAAATCEVVFDLFGQPDEARRMLRVARSERTHLPHDQRWWVNFVLPSQADRLAMAGDLTGAYDHYLHILQAYPAELATECGIIRPRLALLDLERGNLTRALEHAYGEETSTLSGYWKLLVMRVRALVLHALGRDTDARELIYDVIRETDRLDFRFESLRARLVLTQFWLDSGKTDLAARWMDEWADEMDLESWPASFGHAIPGVILGRLLLQQGDITGALDAVQRVIDEGEHRLQTAPLVQVHAFRAFALRQQGDLAGSQDSIRLAMQLGARGRFMRSYMVGAFDTRSLLAAALFSQAPESYDPMAQTESPTPGIVTDREREVLSMVARGLSNAEIADRLFISTYTVKNHLSRTYEKLAVANRREAVEAARSLQLI